jgi:O-antigen/teichoic acid export membrane protein
LITAWKSVLSSTRRDKFYALACNATRSLARVAFGIAVARIAGKADYAIYVALIAGEVIVTTIVQAYAVAPLITLAPGRPAIERDTLLGLAVRRTRVCAGLALGLGVCIAPLAGIFGVRPAVMLAFAFSTAAWCLCNLARGWKSLMFESRQALAADVAGLTVIAAGVVVAGNQGFDLLLAFFVSSTIGAFVILILLRTPGAPSPNHFTEPSLFRQFSSLSGQMMLGSAANAVGSRSQPYVLSFTAGAGAVSLFGAGATMVGPLRLMSMALSNVLRPRLSLHHHGGRTDRYREAVGMTAGALVTIGVLMVTVFVVAGDAIGEGVFGAEFVGLGQVFIWGAVYATLEGIGACLVLVLQTGVERGAAIATRSRGATTLLCLVLIGPACLYGGAAGAFAACALVEAIFVVLALVPCLPALGHQEQRNLVRSSSSAGNAPT